MICSTLATFVVVVATTSSGVGGVEVTLPWELFEKATAHNARALDLTKKFAQR